MRTLERELKLVERTAPPEIRDRVVSEFRSKAESAIQMGVPQAYAQLIEASKVVPAAAIRPNQSPAVRSLLTAVKAIRSGRLAFLPRKTRSAARKLLQRVFASPRAIYRSPAPQTASTVAQQRVLPMVVQGMMRGYENPEQAQTYIDVVAAARRRTFQPEGWEKGEQPESPVDQSAPRSVGGSTPVDRTASTELPPPVVTEAPRSASQPPPERPSIKHLSPQATAQLSHAIPAFNTEGMSGAYDPPKHALAYEPEDEKMHVFDKGSGFVTNADVPATKAPMTSKGSQSAGKMIRDMPPVSGSSNTATGGMGGATPSDSSSGGSVTMTGKMTIEGLPEFISSVEGRLQGLEALARKQNG
jgi:hypothetical protein